MLDILLILMFALIFLQCDRHRKLAVAVFVFEKIFSHISFLLFDNFIIKPVGALYYLPMALFDFLAIFVLSNLARTPKITIELQRICLVSIFANLLAWICWEFYIKHADIYNSFYILLYIFSIYLIIKKDHKNDRNYRIDFWARNLRLHSHKSLDNN